MDFWVHRVLLRFGPRAAPLISIVLAACLGCLIDRCGALSFAAWRSFAFAGLGLALASIALDSLGRLGQHNGLQCRRKARHFLASIGSAFSRPPRITIWLLLATFGLAGSWHHLRWRLTPATHVCRMAPLDGLQSVPVKLQATVDSSVSIQSGGDMPWAALESTSQFRISVSHLHVADQWRLAKGRMWVHVNGVVENLFAGDRVRLTGRLARFRPPMNPAQRDVRAERRAAGLHCYLRVPVPDAIRVEFRPHAASPRWWLARLRRRWDSVLAKHLDAPHYGLAAALLLGRRDHLTQTQRDRFLHTGTLHLLAISGLHVGILASIFLFAARGQLVPYRSGLLLVMLLMVFYAQLTDARAPVMRASVLIQLMCLGWLTRRRSSLGNSLAAAAVVLLVRQPTELFSVGTQLSFLAVATLGIVGRQAHPGPPEDPLDRLLWRTRPLPTRWLHAGRSRIARIVVASFAVWFVTAPLIWHHYHLISPTAIPLNVVLWVPLATALLSGFALFAVEGWSALLANMFAALCGTSLRCIEWFVTWVDSWPYTHFWIFSPGLWAIVAFYLALFIHAFCDTRSSRSVWFGFASGVLVFGFVVQLIAPMNDRGTMRCTFLAVGHGTCAVIRLPDGQVWLYDAGRLGDPRAGVDLVSRFLWSRRVYRINRFILSHLDSDHYSLLPELSKRFRIGLAVTSQPLDGDRPVQVWLRQLLTARGIPTVRVGQGRLNAWAGGDANILYAGRGADRNDNEQSLVLQISHYGCCILLPGDLEGAALVRLMSRPIRRTYCAMAPHHGSQNSQPLRFSNWCAAREFVVSSGEVNNYDSLVRQLAESSVRLWHTAVHGAIETEIGRSGARTSAFHATPLGRRGSEMRCE